MEPGDWQNIVDAIFEAAPALTPREVARGEKTPGLNTAFHEEIANALVARGISRWPHSKTDNADATGVPDVDFFGFRGELKTAKGKKIGSNRSYAKEIDGEATRLLVAAYFDTRPVDGGKAIVPYLVTAGFIGPNDYELAENEDSDELPRGQIVKLKVEAQRRMATIWIDALDELPASLAPTVGDGMLAKLGMPETIGALRAAVATAVHDTQGSPTTRDEKIWQTRVKTLHTLLSALTVDQLSWYKPRGKEAAQWFDPNISYPPIEKRSPSVARP
jgi:hypothetical protein